MSCLLKKNLSAVVPNSQKYARECRQGAVQMRCVPETVRVLRSRESPQTERPLEKPQVRLWQMRPEIHSQSRPSSTRREQAPGHPTDMFHLQQVV